MSDEDGDFVRRIEAKADRKLKAQRPADQTLILGLRMSGMVAWSVVIPTLLGAVLGSWWDRRHPGPHSWTLALLMAGLVIGCGNAWYWVSREINPAHDRTDDPHEGPPS